MINVLMVCLGNICRSPLAEGILKSKVNTDQFFIDSAGTGSWHIGELPDIRSIQVAKKNNINITNQRCRQFVVEDFDEFDLIFVMDNSNYETVISLARNDRDKQKVNLILNQIYPGNNLDVPDPYYDENRGFDRVFEMLNNACDRIAETI
jgi:protein-tyrosine phosphatase